MKKYFYNVGAHMFALDMPDGFLSEKDILSYHPFQTAGGIDSPLLFTLTFIPGLNLIQTDNANIVKLEDDNGCMILSRTKDGSLSFSLHASSGEECCRMWISNDYSNGEACITGEEPIKRYALDTALMLLYAFASSKHETLLVHASAIEYCNAGFIFLGKSGTGKSTHSRQWIENFSGSSLLNDDNPVVRIVDGEVRVYGSPWSGKTPCHMNTALPLKAIVRLHQAPYNRIIPLSGVKAYGAVITSCSFLKWDHEMCDVVHNTVSKVVERVKIFEMSCLPDADAALVCRNEISRDG